MTKKLIIFDLDGTLTPSKQAMERETSELLNVLLQKVPVAIISGASFAQFEKQLGKEIDPDNFLGLYLMPTNGAEIYRWEGQFWRPLHQMTLTSLERQRIYDAFDNLGFAKDFELDGKVIEDRGSQITYSALGQNAEPEKKAIWDPTHMKRKKIASDLAQFLPEMDIKIAGTTSIDITRKGINKKTSIDWLLKHLNIPVEDVLFIGDSLFEGGNDEQVKELGIECIEVNGPEETRKIIEKLL